MKYIRSSYFQLRDPYKVPAQNFWNKFFALSETWHTIELSAPKKNLLGTKLTYPYFVPAQNVWQQFFFALAETWHKIELSAPKKNLLCTKPT